MDATPIANGPLTAREVKVLAALPRYAWTTPAAIAKLAGLANIDAELASLYRRKLARRHAGVWQREAAS